MKKKTMIFVIIAFICFRSYLFADSIKGFCVVSGDLVNVRSEPNIQAPVVQVVKFSEEVDVLTISESTTEINGIVGRWVFVKTKYNIKGWVFDAYLIDPRNNLEKVDTFINCTIEVGFEHTMRYQFYNDGRVECSFVPVNSQQRVFSEGHVYKKGPFYIAVIDITHAGQFMYHSYLVLYKSGNSVCLQDKPNYKCQNCSSNR